MTYNVVRIPYNANALCGRGPLESHVRYTSYVMQPEVALE